MVEEEYQKQRGLSSERSKKEQGRIPYLFFALLLDKLRFLWYPFGTMKEHEECKLCGAPLIPGNEGLDDPHQEGYGILPEGCYLVGEAVCVPCYEEHYGRCDLCDAETEADRLETVDGEDGAFCEYCSGKKKVRKLFFASYSGLMSFDRFFDPQEAEEELASRLEEARGKGFEIVETVKNGKKIFEILEKDDAVMVDDRCGLLWIEKEEIR